LVSTCLVTVLFSTQKITLNKMTLKKDVLKEKRREDRPSRKGVLFREQKKDWEDQVKEYKERNANKRTEKKMGK
jgi:hypothetical protein